jgi:hypothetical protein
MFQEIDENIKIDMYEKKNLIKTVLLLSCSMF